MLAVGAAEADYGIGLGFQLEEVLGGEADAGSEVVLVDPVPESASVAEERTHLEGGLGECAWNVGHRRMWRQ